MYTDAYAIAVPAERFDEIAALAGTIGCPAAPRAHRQLCAERTAAALFCPCVAVGAGGCGSDDRRLLAALADEVVRRTGSHAPENTDGAVQPLAA